jgi:serine protease Do
MMLDYHIGRLPAVDSAAAIAALVGALWIAAPAVAAQEPAPSSLTQFSEDLEALSDRIGASVVQVWVSALAPVIAPGDAPALGLQRRSGSGFIVSPDGFVLTNAHVVAGGREVSVVLSRPAARNVPERSIVRPAGERLRASVVGVDEETDLAVLKVEQDSLPALSFADSDSLRPGNIVLAFGSPLGLESSVSMGIVSAVGRQLQDDHPMVYVQTDAPINPGSSGGPLVDTDGRIVGMNTLILSRSGGNEGIGFAAPSNIVVAVYRQIRTYGRVLRGVIGVEAQTITPPLAAGLRLPQEWGVVVADVLPRSPAAQAGLRPGDIIAALNGKTMENARQFDVNVYRRVGETIRLDVRRRVQWLSIPVHVVERGNTPASVADLVTEDEHVIQELGVLALTVNDDIAQMLPWLREATGVAVVSRAAGTPRVETGLESGDVIRSLNGEPVRALEELRTALRALTEGAAIVLHVDRRGSMRYLAFTRH